MTLDLSMLDGIPPAAPVARQVVRVAPVAPPSAFEEDPEQPRFEFDDDDEFAALVADVKRRGILQPLVVRRMPSGLLRIRFGARRYRASVRAGLAGLPYVETEDERQFDDYAQVAENAKRKPLQPLEQARFIQQKLAQGQRKRDVALAMGIDASALTHLLALTDAPPLLMELYQGRRCRAPYYLYLLRKLMEKDPMLVARQVAEVPEITLSLIEGITRQLEERAAALRPTGTATAPLVAGSHAQEAAGRSEAAEKTTASPADDAGSAKRSRADAVRGKATPKQATLLGHARGRALCVLLDRMPDAEHQVWVEYADDGTTVQLPLAELRLSAVRFGPDKSIATAAEVATSRAS